MAAEALGVDPGDSFAEGLKKAFPSVDFLREVEALAGTIGPKEAKGPIRFHARDGSWTCDVWAAEVGGERLVLFRRHGPSLPPEVSERLERLATLGMLSAGVAHDFNNVLTAILGWAQIALRDPSAKETVENALKIIETNARRAKVVIRDLVESSRPDEGPQLPVNLAGAVDDVLRLLSSWIRTQALTVEREYEKVADISLDRGRLHQVLLNVVLNAIQAMPSGGTLRVGTRAEGGGGAELWVSDTGSGMDAATLARAFDPFFTTKKGGDIGGTGLGLTLCRRFVEQMGGSIRARSEPGRGTEFSISLPARKVEGVATSTTQAGPPPALGCSVLVVDDEPDIREMLTLALRLRGAEVAAVPDAPSARSLLASRPFDLVLLDYTLPGSRGDQVLRDLAAAREGVKFLYISGRTGVDVPLGGAGEALGWIHKPFDLEQVYRAIERVIRG